MSTILNDEQLEAKYARFVDHAGVVAMSEWIEPNQSEELDPRAYLKRVRSNSKAFGEKLSGLLSEPEK
ncbi:MAG: hypothetical protein HQL82_14610 [Magnetococcales bacterium]|nr:hypothetical protein [Magnetococcales bacterium]